LGSVRVPENVDTSAAKITLRFPDWNASKVAPVTVELPIEAQKNLKP